MAKASEAMPDGVVMGNQDEFMYKTFVPKWWQVWRWVHWFMQKRRGTTGIVTVNGFPIRIVRDTTIKLRNVGAADLPVIHV